MARRNIENYRSSIQQVAPQEGIENQSAPLAQVAEIGQDIIRAGQEAKITENFSKVQLELNALNTQYQIDNEENPFGGFAELKQKRDQVFEKYGSEISPFFKRPWQDNMRQLSIKDDAQNEVWAYAQTKKNTVRSINQTIKNNLNQAMVDGQNFGNSDTDEVGTLLNYAANKKQLISFGDKHLGSGTTTDLLESYDDDYLKSFIGGVSESNPIKALRLLEDEKVKGSFKDQSQYMKMKNYIETRALQADKIFTQKEVLNVLKDENSLLGKSLETNVSYVELQKAFDEKKMSKSAQDFFLKANGFKTSAGETKLSNFEKIQNEQQIYDEIIQLQYLENPSTEDISRVQNSIYEGMNNKSITPEKGLSFINGLMGPVVAKKEEALSKFDIGETNITGGEFTPFSDDKGLGFSGLDEVLDDALVPLETTQAGDEAKSASNARANRYNSAKKLELYNFYYDELQNEAQTRGMQVGDLTSLPRSEQRKIYSKAQNEAKYNFWTAQYPSLANVEKENFPSAIVTNDGRKVTTGITNNKISGKVVSLKPQYEFNSEQEMEAAGLPDGTPVILNGSSGIYRKPK